MTYIPKRIYVKLDPKTATKLAELAKLQDSRDPRELAAELLAEKVNDEYDKIFKTEELRR